MKWLVLWRLTSTKNLYDVIFCRKSIIYINKKFTENAKNVLVVEHFVFPKNSLWKLLLETKKDNAEISNKKRIQFLSHFIKGFSTQ